MIASMKPRSSITAASVTYMMPICLWSTLVTHSRHRYGIQPLIVMNASTPRTTTMTKAPANSGIGWSKGMAPQVSLPSILFPHSLQGAWIGLRDRPRTWRQCLIQDLAKQSVRDGLERERFRHDALFGELDVAFRRELISRGAGLTEPIIKFRRRFRHDLEMHAGKSVAAYLSCKAAKGPRVIGQEIELRRHAVHGVDHAAELGDEEGCHHAPRGQSKANRNAGRDDQSVDARDMLVGIDEQPFPVERHDLNIERLFCRNDGPRRVKIMRADPGHAAHKHDGEQRNRPDDQF